MQVLAGDFSGADATLAAAEEGAGELLPELKLRRALASLAAGELDSVKIHGEASGLPEGRLLAAEVHMVDLEGDEAAAILREIRDAGGVVGQTAGTYLAMIESGDPIQSGLVEATALWAVGERSSACELAEELVKTLPDDDDTKSAQLLLWAGRSVTSGQAGIAASLLDEIDFPPEGQNWRVPATRAMISAAEGDVESAARKFKQLEDGGAPADGLWDALATACALTESREDAKRLAEGVESSAAARCLHAAGAGKAARSQSRPGLLKTFLENK
jgi:hypothetical protein